MVICHLARAPTAVTALGGGRTSRAAVRYGLFLARRSGRRTRRKFKPPPFKARVALYIKGSTWPSCTATGAAPPAGERGRRVSRVR
eukprot:7379052-Prymnesium_polylepis.3